ncbi:MAG TPA: hypothetical protein VHJ39_05285 [Solirubrobacteraceae bacterium]|jgi:hypothetical protein|nr:hypothetical protein [Solirubrobacteraceae bacterium]
MGPEALRRIRWGNVGRLAGGLAVIAAVVAWPRLAPPQPALPSEVARPLDGLGIDPAATPPAELLVPQPRQRTRGSERRARETRRGRSATGDARARRKRRARRMTGAGERRRSEVQARPDPGSGAPNGREEGGGVPGSRERASGGQRRPDPPAAADRPAAATPDEDPAQTEFGFEEGG